MRTLVKICLIGIVVSLVSACGAHKSTSGDSSSSSREFLKKKTKGGVG